MKSNPVNLTCDKIGWQLRYLKENSSHTQTISPLAKWHSCVKHGCQNISNKHMDVNKCGHELATILIAPDLLLTLIFLLPWTVWVWKSGVWDVFYNFSDQLGQSLTNVILLFFTYVMLCYVMLCIFPSIIKFTTSFSFNNKVYNFLSHRRCICLGQQISADKTWPADIIWRMRGTLKHY